MENKIEILYKDKVNNLKEINKRLNIVFSLLKLYTDEPQDKKNVEVAISIKF